jgi:hypothetical protein
VVAVAPDRLQRAVLLAPDAVARRAAAFAPGREERWLLGRPRTVRRSYVDEVLDRGDDDVRREIWMLGQDDDVRASFVREVLAPRLAGAGPAHAADG